MWHELLRDSRFHSFLLRCDEDIAETTREGGCPWCKAEGGESVLHRGNYRRKPRGVQLEDPALAVRFSFCCAKEGCRRRVTPRSFRFLARKVYWAGVFVLVSAMQLGATPKRRARLREVFGMCPRTLEHWREWWTTVFAESDFWKGARGAFRTAIDALQLPHALLVRFPATGGLERQLESVLRFLSPITTGAGIA